MAATAISIAFAVIMFAWARSRRRAGACNPIETYGDRTAVLSTNRPVGYDETHASAFRAFMRVHETPPNETALRHYVYVAEREGLDETALLERVKSDLGEDDDIVRL